MKSFKKENITLLHCDCMEYMKDIPDNHFDLAIVDPPYGIGNDSIHAGRLHKGSGKLKNRVIQTLNSKWDDIPLDKNYFKELFRISNNQIIWGGNYFKLGRTRGFIVWDKIQPWDNFSQAEFAWTSFDCPSKIYKEATTRTGEKKIHPTQKSVKLYKWLLKNYATPDMKILDTHGGSMSSAIACHDFGCEMVCLEIDEEYFDSAVKRFDHETIQQTLTFNPS